MFNASGAFNCAGTAACPRRTFAQATGHSLSLIQEYLDLLDEFKLPPLPNPCGKEGPARGQTD